MPLRLFKRAVDVAGSTEDHQFADHEGGRGLRTLAPIRAGEVLVSVPGRVLMNTRSAMRCPDIGPLVAGRMVRSLPYTAPPSGGSILLHPQQVLCLHILWERHKGRHSFWYPFICQLPTTFTTSLFWSDDELKESQSEQFIETVNLQKRELRDLHSSLLRFLEPHKEHLRSLGYGTFEPTLSDFWWASSIINTRSCYIDIAPSIQDHNTLVPFADFLNHANVDSVGSYNAVEDCYEITTQTPFEEGQQAFISYGKHGNEPLIHLYGFAIPDNSEEIYNFVDPLQWLTETDVCLREEKDACLQDASLLTGFYAWPSGELSWNFDVALRVYLLDEDEFVRERKHEKLLVDEEVALNKARKRIEFVINLATMLLSAYPTTLEDDQLLMQQLEQQIGKSESEGGAVDADGADEQRRKKRRKNEGQEEEEAEAEAAPTTTGWWARRCALVLRMGRKQILSNVLHRARNELAQFEATSSA